MADENNGNRMKVIGIGCLALLGLGLIAIFIVASSYNGLVKLDQGVKSAWSQVENQLQRRYDLIPNLVETVKGYATHEKEVFEKVTEARSRWAAASTTQDKVKAAGEVESSLSRLLLVAENYPQLQASANFKELHYSLEGTENRIATERMRYNEAVQDYNTAIRTFPTVVLASMFHFQEAAYFKAAEQAKEVPKVKF